MPNKKIQDSYNESKAIQTWSTDVKMITENIEFRDSLLSNLKSVFDLYERTYFRTFIEAYKAYHLDETDRAKALAARWWEWRTNVRYPLTKMVIDTLFANFYDTQISYKIQPRSPEDFEKAQYAQWFFEWIMDMSHWNNEIFKAAKEAMICWTSFVKVIVKKDVEKWRYLKEIKKWKRIYNEYNREKNYPSISNIDVFSVFIDPSANSINEARYLFQRKIMPYKDAIARYSKAYWLNLSKAETATLIKSPNQVSWKDYSKIKKLPFFKNDILNDITDFNWANFFEVWYYDNDLIEVIEYYQDWKVIILMNWYILYDWETLYPFEWYPFDKVNYEIDTGWLYTKWIWTNLEQFQQISDIILNSYLDQTKLNVAPMYEVDKWSVNEKDIWPNWQLNYVPFKTIPKRDTKPALTPINMTNWDRLWLEALQQLEQYVEFSEWPNQYSMWWNPIERSATWASLKANITKQRLKPLVDSINRCLSELSEKVMLLSWTVYDWKIPIKVIWETWEQVIKHMDMQDIIWQYNIIFETDSLKSVIKEIEKNQLLQFVSQAMPANMDNVRWRPVVDTMKLFRELIHTFNLPEDVLLTDNAFKTIMSKSAAAWQEWQLDAKAAVAEYEKEHAPQQSTPQNPWVPWQPQAPQQQQQQQQPQQQAPQQVPQSELTWWTPEQQQKQLTWKDNWNKSLWDMLSEAKRY